MEISLFKKTSIFNYESIELYTIDGVKLEPIKFRPIINLGTYCIYNVEKDNEYIFCLRTYFNYKEQDMCVLKISIIGNNKYGIRKHYRKNDIPQFIKITTLIK